MDLSALDPGKQGLKRKCRRPKTIGVILFQRLIQENKD